MRALLGILLLASLFSTSALAQESSTAAPNASLASPMQRMKLARSVYYEQSGSRIPGGVIEDALQGWGRYVLVSSPDQADLLITVTAPNSDSGITVGSSTSGDGRAQSAMSTSKTFSSVDRITMVVRDAHNRAVLWSGNEQPKSALKEKAREDNLIESSLTLFRKYRQVIEPEQ